MNKNQHVWIPNAFTPNGDNKNDAFFINTKLITSLNVGIFDRWGKLVFESNDLNFHWNGKDISGTELPEGVYTYKIKAIGYDGEVEVIAGTVTLLR